MREMNREEKQKISGRKVFLFLREFSIRKEFFLLFGVLRKRKNEVSIHFLTVGKREFYYYKFPVNFGDFISKNEKISFTNFW